MAPVEVVGSYRVYNLRASALEHLLHRRFADVRPRLEQIGPDAKADEPSEWYVVPLSAIDQTVHLLVSGDIVDYEYDAGNQTLQAREG